MLVHRIHGRHACDYDKEVGLGYTPVNAGHVVVYECAISNCAVSRKSNTHKLDLSFGRIGRGPIGEGN